MASLVRALAVVTLVACTNGSTNSETDAGTGEPVVLVGVPCSDNKDDVYAPVPDDLPAWDASHRGDVFRCSRDQWISPADVDAQARTDGYLGPELKSGATIFRIAYRTERAQVGTEPAAEGHSSALLLIPDHPRQPGALVVYAHPSMGIGERCAPSRTDIRFVGDEEEVVRGTILGLVGAGWTVIAPDYAGMGYGEVPGWADAEDEAKSLLDATRAARQALIPAMWPQNLVIAGHSVGGHGAFAAHALAPTYGYEGDFVGVVTFAPFWVSNLAWAAIMTPATGYNTGNAPYFFEYQLDYFYAHGELLDGPGHGLDLIQPAKRDAVKQLLTTQCLIGVAEGLPALGTDAADYFDPTAANALAQCGFAGDCTIDPAPTWLPRFVADRPAIAPDGPPILMWFGGMDTTVTPGYARCAMDKLERDLGTDGTTPLTACADPDAVHNGVPVRNVAWASDWIAARIGAGDEPTCTPPKLPSMGGASCPSLPNNQF
jgi:Secretory lipase